MRVYIQVSNRCIQQTVIYEDLALYCSRCSRLGHKSDACGVDEALLDATMVETQTTKPILQKKSIPQRWTSKKLPFFDDTAPEPVDSNNEPQVADFVADLERPRILSHDLFANISILETLDISRLKGIDDVIINDLPANPRVSYVSEDATEEHQCSSLGFSSEELFKTQVANLMQSVVTDAGHRDRQGFSESQPSSLVVP